MLWPAETRGPARLREAAGDGVWCGGRRAVASDWLFITRGFQEYKELLLVQLRLVVVPCFISNFC